MSELEDIIEAQGKALHKTTEELVKTQREYEIFKKEVKERLEDVTSELLAQRMIELYERLAACLTTLENIGQTIERKLKSDQDCGFPYDENLGDALNQLEKA